MDVNDLLKITSVAQSFHNLEQIFAVQLYTPVLYQKTDAYERR
jgi:hypothetical protein